jgi:hypothetical protein
MTALLAMIIGILAVGYAIWPLARRRGAPPLGEELGLRDEERQAQAAALLAWSSAAGEMRWEAESAGPLDRYAS